MMRRAKGIYDAAIEELAIAKKTNDTNAPINEREGQIKQALLERENSRSFQKAMQTLRRQNIGKALKTL